MTKSGEVKKRSRKTEAVTMALCIPEKKPTVECTLYFVGRRQRKCSRMQVWATQFNRENRKKKTKETVRAQLISRYFDNGPLEPRVVPNITFGNLA